MEALQRGLPKQNKTQNRQKQNARFGDIAETSETFSAHNIPTIFRARLNSAVAMLVDQRLQVAAVPPRIRKTCGTCTEERGMMHQKWVSNSRCRGSTSISCPREQQERKKARVEESSWAEVEAGQKTTQQKHTSTGLSE